jgi:SAM-dependent methyltransferase
VATEGLRDYYEARYSVDGADSERAAAWRALGARPKVDHLLTLVEGRAPEDARALEIGSGDGAVLAELHRRRPRWSLSGVEIAERPAALGRERVPADIRVYDGRELPWGDDSFDVALLSHVLEHVPDPPALLREAARVAPVVVVEVPLEANASAGRRSKRRLADDTGHVQRFARADVARLAADAGLDLVRDLTDPLPRAAHLFFASSLAGRLRGSAKWGVRAAIHRASPRAAERLFTVHYACLCARR